jgi:hypothetical protein
MIKRPKDELKRLTSKSKNIYKESNCAKIFNKLDIDNIEKQCLFFKNFLEEFHKRFR